MYSENYKMLIKKKKDNTNRWKNITCSWTGKVNIVTPSPCSPGAHTGDWDTDYVGNINKVLCEQSPGLLILPRGQEAFMEKMQFFLCFEFSNL